MKLSIGFDWHFWVVGIIFDGGFVFLHIGPLGIGLIKTPPHVTMQDLDRAQEEQYADWMAELEDAGLIQRVEIVQRMPSSDKVM